MPELIVPNAVAAVLAAGAAVVFVWLLRGTPAQALESVGGAMLFTAVGVVAGALLARFGATGALIFPADLYNISGMALALAGLYVGRFRRLPSLSAAVAATAALFFLAAALLGGAPTFERSSVRTVLTLHILFVAAGAGFLLLLGLLAAMYLAKERAIRARRTGGLMSRTPSLEVLDRYQLTALQVGFLLLTIGVGFGLLLMGIAAADGGNRDLLAYATIAVWGLLGWVLFLRLWRGWRGHRMAALSGWLVVGLLVAVVVAFEVTALRHGGN